MQQSAELGHQADFSCRLCGSDELYFYFALGNDLEFRYFRCPRCKLVNLDLTGGLDQEQYIEKLPDPADDDDPRNALLDASFDFLLRYTPQAKSILDIGCGSGRLLYRAQQAGWAVKGLELFDAPAERIRRELGIDVVTADFLEFEPPEEDLERYDIVCLRHVLEHLPDSKLAMRKLHALLKPGGHALLEMPNIDAFDKRFKRLLAGANLHHKRYPPGFVTGHCNEFCRDSFVYLLGLTGFRLVRWETYSSKPLSNQIYTRIHIGNKARALARRVD